MKRFREMPQKLRRGILIALSLVLLAGLSYGILLIIRANSSEVNVYSVKDAKADYYGIGQSETSGKVFADRIQSVYVSSTQIVTEINVSEGDSVKKGDVLMSFDTTLSDIELKRQEIQIGKLELEIQQAEKNLKLINTYRVGSPVYNNPYYDQSFFGFDIIENERGKDSEYPCREPFGTDGTAWNPYIFVWDRNWTVPDGFVPYLFSKPYEGDDPGSRYVVFEIRENDSMYGPVRESFMIQFTESGGSYSFTVMDVPPDYDPINPVDSTPFDTATYISSAAELADMKREAQEKIDSLKMDLKKAKYKYSVLEYELTTGTVYSNIDGKVITVADPEEVNGTKDPVLVVSGGGGYFVSGVLSETELSSMHVGDSVNVMSWESYQNYSAEITEISEYPVDNSDNSYSHYSEGNTNTSLYAFTAAIENGAKVREGEFLNITYSPKREGSSGLYLSNMFIRSENGVHYVLAESENGTLERREVHTGGTLWGSYTEILSGLDTEDHIAFPYGRHTRVGAKVRECPIELLYNY